MEKTKPGFEDFIASVPDSNKEFVNKLHQTFLAHGCKIEVKEAKSGYMVSYTFSKKTIANFVFRKTGVIVRIFAKHIQDYMEFFETLPDSMVKTIQEAPVCKRLLNPNDCNPKCAMGYDFVLQGERLQKCRNGAFMFLLCEENNASIKMLLENELKACN